MTDFVILMNFRISLHRKIVLILEAIFSVMRVFIILALYIICMDVSDADFVLIKM
jgi:hypothetical protein